MTVSGMSTEKGYTGEERLENFPVPVRISTTKIPGFVYDKCDGEDDISFSDEDGKILPHEVEVWNTDGESVAWVSLPVMTNNAVFYMNWKHKTKLADTRAQEVWTGANYVGVWHMNEYDPEKLTQYDSTGHGFNATYVSSSKTTGISASGKIGAAFYRNFSNTTDGHCATTPKLSSVMKMDWNGCILSGWAYYKTWAANNQHTFFWVNTSSSGTKYWGLVTSSKVIKGKFSTAGAIALGTNINPSSGWVHWAIRVTGKTTYDYFLNGVYVSSATKNDAEFATLSATSQWYTGGNTGYLDEMRYRNGDITDEWVKAEYDSIQNTNFIVASAAVNNGNGFFVIVR